jgi:hypothetical protein
MEIDNIISIYDNIRTKLFIDDEEYAKAFINRLNGCFKFYPQEFENNNFEDIISVKLVEDCTLSENDFTKFTIEKANDYIVNSNIDAWKDAFQNSANSYLFKLTIIILSKGVESFSKLPESASLAYREVIVELAKNNTMPDDIKDWDLLLDYLDARKLKMPFKSIRDNFIYSPNTVDVEAVRFLEKGLFKFGGLDEKDKVADVLRKIIIPCINDTSGFKDVIYRNRDKVIEINKSSTDHEDDVFEAFRAIRTEENEEKLMYFSEKLEFALEQEVIEEEIDETE